MSWDFFSKTNKTDLKTSFYDSVDLIPTEHWESLDYNNIYLSLPYLKSIEDSLREVASFHYVLFYDTVLQPVGLAYVQILNFVDSGNKYTDELCKLGDSIKHKILGNIDLKVMICGNAFSCGENGFYFSDKVSSEEAYSNLSNALFKLRRSEVIDGQVSMVLLKEFWPESFDQLDTLKENGYRDFHIDVNMVLDVHDSWNTLDDYMASLTSKFRTKAKQVFRKSEDVLVNDFSVDDIDKHASAIETLYQNVLDKADFKFGELNAKAFCLLKKNLGKDFKFKGYFLNDELIGFSTAYHFNDVLDANYVGINYDYNASHMLYQRMLYDYVVDAIEFKVHSLRLGRTAELIKSSIGAEPVEMKLFLRHKNVISNRIIKHIVDSISPSKFELRQPFKAEFKNG